MRFPESNYSLGAQSWRNIAPRCAKFKRPQRFDSNPALHTSELLSAKAVCYGLTRVSRWDSLSSTGHLIQSGGGIGPSKPQQPDLIYGSLVLSPAPVSGAKIR